MREMAVLWFLVELSFKCVNLLQDGTCRCKKRAEARFLFVTHFNYESIRIVHAERNFANRAV